MIYMLDTNIIIYLMKNRPKIVAERVSQLLPNDRLVMSFITYAELIKGAFGSQNYEQSIRAIELLTERVNVLYPNMANGQIHSKNKGNLSEIMTYGLLATL